MPELPEVETIRAALASSLTGSRLVAGDSHPSTKFVDAREAVGTTIEKVGRRGKYLIADLDDDRQLIVHLGMTGQLGIRQQPELDEYVRAWWELDDGATLVFRDVRRFGRIRVVDHGDYSTISTLHHLGPEPFDAAFTADHLHSALSASSRRIKTQLLSQRPVAGVGNIYADEALWLAQLYPAARAITRPGARRLHQAIIGVLKDGIENGGTTLRDYRNAEGQSGSNQFHLQCYGRGGLECYRCGTELRSRVWDARNTTWCPTCQRR